MKDKKGLTLNALYPAVLTIVLVGIVLGIGLYVMNEVRDNIATDYSTLDAPVFANGSNGIWTTNATTLSNASLSGYELQSATVIEAATGTTIPAANYSINTGTGVITFTATTAINNATANVTSIYNYDRTDSPEAAMSTAATGLAGLATWIAIIVVVLAAAVVLGVVLSSFGREPGV